MDKSFISVLIEPIPVEKKLATEVKIRDIIAGESKPEPTSKNNGALEDVVDE